MADSAAGFKVMIPQEQEPNLIDNLRGLLTRSERLLAEPHFEPANIRRFRRRAKVSLTKIYGADSELIQEFNSVADAANLVSDPKVGLQRMMFLVERIINSLRMMLSLG